MSDPKSGPGDVDETEIAAAEWLIEERPATASQEPQMPGAAGPVESFDLVDSAELPVSKPGRLAPLPSSEWDHVDSDAPASRPRRTIAEGPVVEQVWSRGAEWGGTLAVLACWMLAVLVLGYFAMSAELAGLAGVLLLAGLAGAVVLSYPIVITLERPVRITPEQAARDYFSALSHHLPHYRRMWLLLSSRGRTSSRFASYEGFKSYWNDQLRALRDGHASGFTPLVFQVHDFQAEKSAGRSEIEARFKIRVLVRGRRDAGAVHGMVLKRSFSRGPDGMWYLDDGTLTHRDADVATTPAAAST